MEESKGIFDIGFGLLSLSIVVYRIIYFMVPEVKESIKNRDLPTFFKSLTLLV